MTKFVFIDVDGSPEVPVPDTGLTFGRHPDCDLTIREASVSSRHGSIRLEGGSWVLRDNGSSNGTFVNDQQISSVVISDGDLLQFGDVRVRFVCDDPEPAPAPAPAPVPAPAPRPTPRPAPVPMPASAPEPADPAPSVDDVPPALLLPVDRSLLSWVVLSFVTLGIYPVIALSNISMELNLAATKRDHLHTHNGVLVALLGALTIGIYPLVWFHKTSNRIGKELQARGIDYRFDASLFWLWAVLGSLIIIGPLVYIHKLTKAMNQLNAHYNAYGAKGTLPPRTPFSFAPLLRLLGRFFFQWLPVVVLVVCILISNDGAWWGWRYVQTTVFLEVMFLVGAILLAISRFTGSKATACLWILCGLGQLVFFVLDMPAYEPVSLYVLLPVFAAGEIVAGVSLLPRKRKGAMVGLFIAAAGLLFSMLGANYLLDHWDNRDRIPYLSDYCYNTSKYSFAGSDRYLRVSFVEYIMAKNLVSAIGFILLGVAARKVGRPKQEKPA